MILTKIFTCVIHLSLIADLTPISKNKKIFIYYYAVMRLFLANKKYYFLFILSRILILNPLKSLVFYYSRLFLIVK